VLNHTAHYAAGAKVLVVEDSAAMRARIVWELAELSGIEEILQAEDLASALSLLEAYHPAIAVLDLHLRKELAFPILERIQQRQLPTISIVFSNAGAGPLKDACLRLGARAFLSKSSGFEGVLNAVSELLISLPSSRPEHSAAPLNRESN
jgi:two-component system, NarL family, response regulator EvgA